MSWSRSSSCRSTATPIASRPQNRYWTSGYPHEVKDRLARPLKERYHILKQGEKLVIKKG